jgi:hypothetical protein
MDRRLEPRFEIFALAEVTVLDDPNTTLSASLTAMSAEGLRLRAPQELPPGRLIAVELEHHMVLAEVRHIHRDGSQYTIGAKRIHTLAKELPMDSTRLAKVEALVNDFQINALTREINSCGDEPCAAELQELPRESSFESHPETLAPPECGNEAGKPLDGATDLDFTDTGLVENFRPEPSMTFYAIPRATEPVLPLAMVPGHPQSTSAAFLNALNLQTQKHPASEPVAARESTTPCIGLDPARPDNKGFALRSKAVLFGIVVGATLVQVGAMWFGTYRVSANIDWLPKSGTVSTTPPESQVLTAPATAAEAGKSRLATLNATANTWVTACSDGQIVFENLLRPEGRLDVRFSRLAVIRVGNAGGVAITVDGKPMGALGGPGMVRVLELQPDQTRLVPPNLLANLGECRLP